MMLTAQSDDGQWCPTACAARNHGCRGAGGKGVKSRSSLRISSWHLPSVRPALTLITGRSRRAFQLLRFGCCRGGVPLKIGGARGRQQKHTTQLPSLQTWKPFSHSWRSRKNQPALQPPPARSLHGKARTVRPFTTPPPVLLKCRALPSTPIHRARPSLPAPSDLGVDHASICNLQGPETLHVDRDHGILCATCWHEPYEFCY